MDVEGTRYARPHFSQGFYCGGASGLIFQVFSSGALMLHRLRAAFAGLSCLLLRKKCILNA